jgi:DNA (cytosine-5)-methyltransferase 1
MTNEVVRSDPNHVELFAGGGGLAYGLRAAGCRGGLLVESNAHACDTLTENSKQGRPLEGVDVRKVDVHTVKWTLKGISLLAAGAPCQPFSLGGKHLAHSDDRNLFPEVLRATRDIRPRAVLLENVSGIVRSSIRPYFDYILRQLEYPELAPKEDESWEDHDKRLQRHQASRSYEPQYVVSTQVMNAADYGVPQTRRRVFVVALKGASDPFAFTEPTHSQDALRVAQRGADYWEERGLSVPENIANGLPRHRGGGCSELRPWKTVRDALSDLPAPKKEVERDALDHWLIPGARTYKGHSGSHLDWPSKTIKAGVHGVPGGENTVILEDGSVRYYTLREAAAIQTFPNAYRFPVSRSEAIRQIGNAVPCQLAQVVATALRTRLLEGE